ncbi:MAG: AAA family ATPase [Oscillospiraceae bacterium]|jgi:guanylate kinase|nr:AAA family ATPase [Oscillospiraceae bacterium]
MKTSIFIKREVAEMNFEGIVITGTSCAGKSTIANELCKPRNSNTQSSFQLIKAITTRARRDDDNNYDYVTDEDFDLLVSEGKLLITSTYRGCKYGIKNDESDKVFKSKKNKTPILILTSEATKELSEKYYGRFMSFFIDADNDELLYRKSLREKRTLANNEKEYFTKLINNDREYSFVANYVVYNNENAPSVQLIELLWNHKNNGGGLSHNIIQKMIQSGMLLDKAEISKINGASYDLSLGDEYYYGGKINYMTDKNPFLTIEPYDYAIVSCTELARMPRDVTGKFGLTVSLFCQGIILSNGPSAN